METLQLQVFEVADGDWLIDKTGQWRQVASRSAGTLIWRFYDADHALIQSQPEWNRMTVRRGELREAW
jgi:hypothetical protein